MTNRLAYITDSAPQAQTATAQAVRERRGGTLFNLDRILLHSEPLARGWPMWSNALAPRRIDLF